MLRANCQPLVTQVRSCLAPWLLVQAFERNPAKLLSGYALHDSENKVWYHYLVQVGWLQQPCQLAYAWASVLAVHA
jgi:hypothetical protein